jgi:hypothetical protein
MVNLYRVSVSSTNLVNLLIRLGNHVNGLVSYVDMWYVIVLGSELAQIREILLEFQTVAISITQEDIDLLMQTTQMNICTAIQLGQITRPGRKHQHVWDDLCKKAGIVDKTYHEMATDAIINSAHNAVLHFLWAATKICPPLLGIK